MIKISQRIVNQEVVARETIQSTQPSTPIRSKRPFKLDGTVYKIKPADNAYYITITNLSVDGKIRPYELFINTRETQSYDWIMAFSRLVSAIFRREDDVSFLCEELKVLFDPAGGYWNEGHYHNSLIAHIGEVLQLHLESIGYLHEKKFIPLMTQNTAKCPKCKEPTLSNQDNCLTCTSCGWSKCS